MKYRTYRTTCRLLLGASALAPIALAQPVTPQPPAEASPPLTGEPALPPEPPPPSATDPTEPEVPVAPEQQPARVESWLGVEGGLTADEVARRAADTSREAEAKQAEYKAADAAVSKTFYGIAPRLTLTARYTRLSPVTNPSLGGGGALVGTTADPGPLPAGAPLFAIDSSAFSFPILLNQYFLNAGLVVPISDYLLRTTQAIRGTRAVRKSAELNEQAARVTDGANAKLAYYSWVGSKLQAAVAAQNLAQAQRQLKQVETLYQAGRVAEADVLQARAFAADSQLMLQRAQTVVSVSEQQLKMAMHAGAEEHFEVGENVLAPFPASEETKDLDALYQESIQSRLEIRALEQSEYSFREASSAQQAGAYPRLEAFGNVTYANPNQRIFPQEERWRATWDVGLQMIWTLNDLGTESAEARTSEAQREQIVARKNAIKDALRVEILSAVKALEEAKLSVVTASQGEKAAEAALAAREQLYQYGRATHFELMQAETARFQARLNSINAHIALRTARVQLDHAVGRDVPEILK